MPVLQPAPCADLTPEAKTADVTRSDAAAAMLAYAKRHEPLVAFYLAQLAQAVRSDSPALLDERLVTPAQARRILECCITQHEGGRRLRPACVKKHLATLPAVRARVVLEA